jgi:hypothetical protein
MRAVQRPCWQEQPPPQSIVPPRHSLVHIVPEQSRAAVLATQVVGWQHSAGTQSASDLQLPSAAVGFGAGAAASMSLMPVPASPVTLESGFAGDSRACSGELEVSSMGAGGRSTAAGSGAGGGGGDCEAQAATMAKSAAHETSRSVMAAQAHTSWRVLSTRRMTRALTRPSAWLYWFF